MSSRQIPFASGRVDHKGTRPCRASSAIALWRLGSGRSVMGHCTGRSRSGRKQPSVAEKAVDPVAPQQFLTASQSIGVAVTAHRHRPSLVDLCRCWPRADSPPAIGRRRDVARSCRGGISAEVDPPARFTRCPGNRLRCPVTVRSPAASAATPSSSRRSPTRHWRR